MAASRWRRWGAALALVIAAPVCAQVDAFQKQIPAADVAALKKAQALRAQKKPAEAVAALQSLVARQPDYFNAQFELALAISDTPADIAKSIPAFEKAAELKRRHPEVTDARVFNSLGWAYMYNADSAHALKAFKEAEEHLDQLSPEIQRRLYNNIGYLNLLSGRRSEADKYTKLAADKGSKAAQTRMETLEAGKKQ